MAARIGKGERVPMRKPRVKPNLKEKRRDGGYWIRLAPPRVAVETAAAIVQAARAKQWSQATWIRNAFELQLRREGYKIKELR